MGMSQWRDVTMEDVDCSPLMTDYVNNTKSANTASPAIFGEYLISFSKYAAGVIIVYYIIGM